MKRIGIDARFWGEAGPGRYASNLVRELEKIDHGNEYFIFLTSKGFEDYKPEASNFHKVLANYRWYSFSEQLKYPKLLYQYRLDLLHFAQFNMPLLYLKPFAVTIHDMILHDYPIKKGGLKNVFLYPFKRLGYLVIFWWAAKRARAIVVPSEDAKKDLITRLGIKPEKITVTMEGVNNNLKLQISKPKSTSQIAKLGEKYSVNKPYILYVGSMYPHKNLERLVEAFGLIVGKFRQFPNLGGWDPLTSEVIPWRNLSLVLVGKESYFSEQLREKVKELGLDGKVFFPGKTTPDGYVPDEDLPSFYTNASVYVFPSLKEGFGIPPLEAMSFGVPVAASKISCIPDVCGDAALYFNPHDPRDIAEKIQRVLYSESIRCTLIKRGKENLKRFSWQRMASQTLGVFREALFH